MNIALEKAQQDWIDAQVAAGRFTSQHEAIALAVARLQADEATGDDTWVRPLIEDGLAALDRGEGTPWRKGEALDMIKARRSSGT